MSRVSSSSSIASIQVLRGLAAFSVVFCHLRFEYPDWPNAARILMRGQVGVDVFFVISGFVMVYASQTLFGKPGSPKIFFGRRLARIMPVYWLMSIIMLTYLAARHPDFTAINLPPQSIVASFLLVPLASSDGTMRLIHDVGWTLVYEMYFYAVFACAITLTRTHAVLVVTGALATIVLLGAAVELPFALRYYANPIVFEFVFGMILALLYLRGVRIPIWAAIAFGAVALCGFAVFGAIDMAAPERPLALGVPALLLVGASVLAQAHHRRQLVVLAGVVALGDISYAVYLAHPILHGAGHWVVPTLLGPKAYPLPYATTLVAVDIVAAVCIYRYFERPLTKFLKDLVPRLGARAPAMETPVR